MDKKLRRAAMLPLIFVFAALMSVAVYAKPVLSSKKLTFYKQIDYDTYTNREMVHYDCANTLIVKGVNRRATVVSKYSSNPAIKIYTVRSGNKLIVYGVQNEEGLLRSGKYGANIVVRNKNKNYTLRFKIQVKNSQPRYIAWLKAAGKTYKAQFAPKNAGLSYINLPVGKPVRISYKTTEGNKKMSLFLQRGETSRQIKGKVTLQKGDILQLYYKRKGIRWAECFKVIVR